MNINEIKSDILNEKYYKINHPSGLTVYPEGELFVGLRRFRHKIRLYRHSL